MSKDNVLTFGSFRYAVVALVLTAASLAAYLANPEPGPSGGDTWVGYGLGTVGVLLIVWLTLFGVRKRRYASRIGTVQGWLSAHVWLGLALTVVGTLHTGLQFGWNVHTLAYGLMLLVIASGAWGLIAYFRYPDQLAGLLDGRSPAQHAQALAELDAQSRVLAAPLPAELQALVEASSQAPLWSGPFGRLRGRVGNCPTRRAVDHLAPLARGEERRLRDLYALQFQRLTRLERLRRYAHRKTWTSLWLLLHVPLTFGLLAALIAHVVAVFTYW